MDESLLLSEWYRAPGAGYTTGASGLPGSGKHGTATAVPIHDVSVLLL